MKYYLTKEWFYDMLYPLTLKRGIEVSEKADRADEEIYQEFYKKALDKFMNAEKKRLSPLDANDLPWLDKTLARSGLPEAMQKNLKVMFWKEIEKSQKGFEIDEEALRRKFGNHFNNKRKLCAQLPKEILEEVADIRVFCLGYMTQKVKDILSAYLEEKEKENLHLLELSYNQTQKAEAELKNGIRFLNYTTKTLLSIEKNKNNVRINFVGLPTLVVKDARIIEWEGMVHKPQKYFEGWAKRKPPATTVAEGVEVYKTECGYELHFLMCNESNEGKRLAWNFTVSGSDIDSEGEYISPPTF